MSCLRVSNDSCCSVSHTKGSPFLSSLCSGSATCAKLGINFAEYCTSCTNERTSDTFLGTLAFTTAAIFSSLGVIPWLLNLCPKKVNFGSLNWHLSPFRVSPLPLRRCKTACKFLSCFHRQESRTYPPRMREDSVPICPQSKREICMTENKNMARTLTYLSVELFAQLRN